MGQAEIEHGTLAGLGFSPDLPAVGVDDAFTNIKAEAGAFLAGGGAGTGALEWLK